GSWPWPHRSGTGCRRSPGAPCLPRTRLQVRERPPPHGRTALFGPSPRTYPYRVRPVVSTSRIESGRCGRPPDRHLTTVGGGTGGRAGGRGGVRGGRRRDAVAAGSAAPRRGRPPGLGVLDRGCPGARPAGLDRRL